MKKGQVSIGVYLKTRPLRFGKGREELLRRMDWPGGRRLPVGPRTLAAGWLPCYYRGGWHGEN
jgi:hypothetical protein